MWERDHLVTSHCLSRVCLFKICRNVYSKILSLYKFSNVWEVPIFSTVTVPGKYVRYVNSDLRWFSALCISGWKLKFQVWRRGIAFPTFSSFSQEGRRRRSLEPKWPKWLGHVWWIKCYFVYDVPILSIERVVAFGGFDITQSATSFIEHWEVYQGRAFIRIGVDFCGARYRLILG